jgi:LysM repeat protein
MKECPWIIAVAAISFSGISCKSMKLGGDPSGGVQTDPYEDMANGGYATGDFYGTDTNPYAAAPATHGDRYAQAYGNSGPGNYGETYDHVNVIPFTDNGSSRYPGSTAEPNSDLPRAPSPGATESKPPTRKPVESSSRSTTAARRSAAVVSAGRGSSGASSGRTAQADSGASGSNPARKSATRRQKVHVVARGDTLYRISRTYGVPVETLKRRNQLDSDLIRVGKELVIR